MISQETRGLMPVRRAKDDVISTHCDVCIGVGARYTWKEGGARSGVQRISECLPLF